jgi:hypothetical protein
MAPRAAKRAEARPWPDVTPGDAREAAWRATVQERLDSLEERIEDVLEAVTQPHWIERVWRHSCEVIANPSKGTVALAALLVVVLLAVLGWTAADVAALTKAIPVAPGAP